MRPRLDGPWWALAAFVALAAVSLAGLCYAPFDIPFWRDAGFSDLLLSHWPNASFLKRSLVQWNQIPLWNPMILSGAPFAADPLSGLWYPPNWLALVLPIPAAFNLLLWLHLAWTGWGMYRWMRHEAKGQAAAWVAAFAWMGASKWIAHVGLGHLTLICAVSWTPWALSLVRATLAGCQEGTRAWRRAAAAWGLVFGLSFLADPRWSLPLLLFVLSYALKGILHSRTRLKMEGLQGEQARKYLAASLMMGFCAAGISSGLGLPLVEFTRLSTRAGITGAETSVLSLPVSRLLGFLTPFLDQPEWLAYSGILVLFLAFTGAIIGLKRTRFWILVVLVSVVLALGNQTPLYSIITRLIPGADLLRVPPRALFIASFGLAVMAGFGVEFAVNHNLSTRQRRRLGLGSMAFTALAVMFNVSIWVLSGKQTALPLGIALIAIVGAIWFAVCRYRRVSYRVIVAGWLFLMGLDVLWVNPQLLEVRDTAQVLRERIEIAEILNQDGYARSFSPSYSIPQQTAARVGLQLADGVNPLQLKTYRDYMAAATGFVPSAYSVTLPPFPGGMPNQPWGVKLDSAKLGKLNVRYVVSDYPIEADHFSLVQVQEGVSIYENEMVMARAWLQQGDTVQDWRPVEIERWTPNRISMVTTGPGKLVLSEMDYPGWVVSVDGNPDQIERIDDVLRGVDLGRGEHRIVFEFRPITVYIGALFSLLTFLLALWMWIGR